MISSSFQTTPTGVTTLVEEILAVILATLAIRQTLRPGR
jgi:hypothetical protein